MLEQIMKVNKGLFTLKVYEGFGYKIILIIDNQNKTVDSTIKAINEKEFLSISCLNGKCQVDIASQAILPDEIDEFVAHLQNAKEFMEYIEKNWEEIKKM